MRKLCTLLLGTFIPLLFLVLTPLILLCMGFGVFAFTLALVLYLLKSSTVKTIWLLLLMWQRTGVSICGAETRKGNLDSENVRKLGSASFEAICPRFISMGVRFFNLIIIYLVVVRKNHG